MPSDEVSTIDDSAEAFEDTSEVDLEDDITDTDFDSFDKNADDLQFGINSTSFTMDCVFTFYITILLSI